MKRVRMRCALVVLCLLCITLARAGEVAEFRANVYTGKSGDALPYRFLSPAGIEAAKPSQKYPLVVFLHGAGECGTDNQRQITNGVQRFAEADFRAEYPCFVLVPQCPNGKRWVETDWDSPVSHQQPQTPSYAMGLLLELLPGIIKENAIDTTRIYVIGLSMGGYGTWDLLARRPELFAAGIPICGGADSATAPKIVHIPLWVWHGSKDFIVPTVRSQLIVDALKKAGGQPKYSELPEAWHDIWVQAFKDPDMLKWLFSQQKKAK